MQESYDVLVVGGGNAALCAALSAQSNGASVLVLERAPEQERGGNSRFTAGSMRFAFDGVEDIKELVPDLTEEELRNTEFGSYSEADFLDDVARLTEYRCDPDLVEILVRNSHATVRWLRTNGVRFIPKYGKQAYKIGGKFKFSGGVVLEVSGGGETLVAALYTLAFNRGIEVSYDSHALSLISNDGGVRGVRARIRGKTTDIKAKSVVLACGGFEANTEWRARYLGPGWDMIKVRGSRFNTGDGLRMALDIGAMPYGNWSGCHVLSCDVNAPSYGDLTLGDAFAKNSFPFGILINTKGERFFDEGTDFFMYSYVNCARALLTQPLQVAWQVFDEKTRHLLRDEYRIKQVTKVRANSLEELAEKLEGVDRQKFLQTVREFNAAVQPDKVFDPNAKDGLCTKGLTINKSNWANPIDKPPYEAYAVTAGITFTFGGVKVNANAQIMDTNNLPIPGLYAAGEMVGGLFYSSYPGASGLMSGAVFGRTAGLAASNAIARTDVGHGTTPH